MAFHPGNTRLLTGREVLLTSSKDISSSFLNDLVHEFDQVGRLVGLLIHLCEVLDSVIHKIFLSLAFFTSEVNIVKIVLNIFFALLVNIWSIDKTKGLDHDRETRVKALVSYLNKLPGEGV